MHPYYLRVFSKTRDVSLIRFEEQDGTLIDERLVDRTTIDQFAAQVEEEYRKVGAGLSRLGQLLYEWMDGPTQRWLERILNTPTGLALHIDVEERLRHLPWELMAPGPQQYICTHPLRPFTPVRHVTDSRLDTAMANRPLRVLFMATSPEDVRPFKTANGNASLPHVEVGTLEQSDL